MRHPPVEQLVERRVLRHDVTGPDLDLETGECGLRLALAVGLHAAHDPAVLAGRRVAPGRNGQLPMARTAFAHRSHVACTWLLSELRDARDGRIHVPLCGAPPGIRTQNLRIKSSPETVQLVWSSDVLFALARHDVRLAFLRIGLYSPEVRGEFRMYVYV